MSLTARLIAHRVPVLAACLAMLLGAAAGWGPAAHGAGAAEGSRDSEALHVEEKGAGRPLILIHGLGASTFTWRHIVPRLAREHRVISVDLLGHGRSAAPDPADANYSAQAQAERVAGLVREFGLTDFDIVGHSFGGDVAVRAALLLEPEGRRVGRLALIASPVLPGVLPRYLDLLLVRDAPEAVIEHLPHTFAARQILTMARARGSRPSPKDVAGYASPYESIAARRAFLATARAIIASKDDALARKLTAFAPETLLVWCRNDRIVPLAAGRKLARLIPHSRLKIMPECNHLPQDERPQELLRILEAFLAP